MPVSNEELLQLRKLLLCQMLVPIDVLLKGSLALGVARLIVAALNSKCEENTHPVAAQSQGDHRPSSPGQ